MKKTLDGLLQSEFKPSEVVMYKSDGPLRKLKVLSDHWISKAKESSDKCSPAQGIFKLGTYFQTILELVIFKFVTSL